MTDGPDIEGYSDLQRLARGGFGTVYRAHQDRFGRVVALKVLDVEALDEAAQRRFERECLAMGSLSWHPNVVALHDSGITADGHPYLVMEFLEAGSLGDRLGHGPVAWPHAVRAGVEVSGALGAAHATGTLHRDLKPENLLVGPFGETKLGDFGIAAVEGSARSSSGVALTVAHVAPEVLRGDEPDERADVYGLASTLHTLVAGTTPIDTRGDLAAVLARVLHTPAARLGPEVPPALAALLQQGLAKDPAARPEDAATFGRALQAIQVASGHPVTALRLTPGDDERPPPPPVPPTPRVTAPPAPRSPSAVPTTAPGPPRPSASGSSTSGSPSPLLVGGLVAAFALVAVIGLVAVLLARGGSDGGDGGGTAASTTSPTAPGPQPTVTATVAVGASPQRVDLTADAAWVASSGSSSVARIDLATDEVTATIPTGLGAFGVAATEDAVWVSNSGEGTVSRIDPATDEVVSTVELRALPSDLTATEDDVWVTGGNNGTLTHLDARTEQPVRVVSVGTNPNDVSLGADALWVVDPTENAVFRLDPETDRVEETIELRTGSRPNSVVATDDAVWVTGFGNASLFRIDPSTNEVAATVEVGNGPTGLAVVGEAAWVANQNDGTLSLVDTASELLVATIEAGEAPNGVAASDEVVWVTNFTEAAATRVDPAAG